MKTLIVFASKHGCTKKCAQLLKNEIHDQVDVINLKETQEVDITKYDKVVIGGSIYMGGIQKSVTKFCSKKLNQLKEKKIGLFFCGMMDGETILKEINQIFPQELIDHAEVKDYFGGEFIFNKMNFFEKIIVKKVVKVTADKSTIREASILEFAEVMNAI